MCSLVDGYLPREKYHSDYPKKLEIKDSVFFIKASMGFSHCVLLTDEGKVSVGSLLVLILILRFGSLDRARPAPCTPIRSNMRLAWSHVHSR
jgi:hypothetical protein